MHKPDYEALLQSAKRSRTILGSRTAAKPVVNACSIVAVAQGFIGAVGVAHAP